MIRTNNSRTGDPPETVDDLIDRYLAWADEWYRRAPDEHGGRAPTGEAANLRSRLERLRKVAGHKRPDELRAEHLCAVQQLMLEERTAAGKPLTRNYINRTCDTIRRCVWWATKPPRRWVERAVPEDLDLAERLRRIRTTARESRPVEPVPPERVKDTLVRLSEIGEDPKRTVWALQLATMIEVQRYTGMRSGELVELNIHRLTTERAQLVLWEDPVEFMVYRPLQHKGRHRGFDRTIFIGPFPRRLIEDWARWRATTDGRLFSYRTTNGYQHAIAKVNRAAGIPRWTNHQLRHLYATEIRAESGLDVVQVLLGHQHLSTSEMYARPTPANALMALYRHQGERRPD